MKTLIFVHGWESFTNEIEYQKFLRETYWVWQSEVWTPETRTNWVQEIAKKWYENGNQVFMPVFPNKLNARYNEWKIVFEWILTRLTLEDEVTFVGGSLGGCFLLKYFSEVGTCHSEEQRACPDNQEQILPIVSMTGKNLKIHQIHLLAACISVWDFTPPSNYEFLQKLENRLHIWHAEDDAVVPFSTAQELSHLLPDAQTHFSPIEKWYWHFHGIVRIPELENVIFGK